MKGQMSTDVFKYILMAIITGLILLVGYRAITFLSGTFAGAEVDDFISDFTSKADKYSGQYGSREVFEYSLPGYEVCFHDSMQDGSYSPELKSNSRLAEYRRIQIIVEGDSDQNVHLLKEGDLKESFYVENLDVESDFLCVNNGKIWIEGGGRTALIREYEEGSN